jgi:hypothetical protein
MLVLAAIAMIMLAFALPLVVRSEHVPPEDPVPPTQHLEDRKAAIYENLRDLQVDFHMGKMSSADYAASKRELQKELAGVLAGIEEVRGGGSA